ncbi:DUF6602 domain-containing protein [Streptomyces californicus]|uniref:DUF6602 domain-containing protein n=1 Tax=Streptomyces californicus TaxID=67351 RepID=UPI001E61B159|nr:DUF6602 domain-containing protein [Streptomyces californicus]MCC0578391.1 hypothetical protein [Streptomyces californicus]
MIRTVADLLLGIIKHELPKLDSAPVRHAPTIGDMYEGLSSEVLSRALPDGLGLRVVSGFACDDHSRLSGQIDCMIVRGDGEKLPYVESYVWHVKDIIAVIEVKKNLHSAELRDAVAHLGTVSSIERPYYQSDVGQSEYENRSVAPSARTFAEMTGRVAWDGGRFATLAYEDDALLGALFLEQLSSVRVILGMHGFKSERAFRAAMVNCLETFIREEGIGPTDFPQLIISGSYSLAKANGRPFMVPLVDGWWSFYFSTPENPLRMLLEFIWTRLDEMYGFGSQLWGEDLETEVGRALLGVRPTRYEGKDAWEARVFNLNDEDLTRIPTTEQWSPQFINLEEFILLERLCRGKEVRSDDPEILSYLTDRGVSFDEVADRLVRTRLVARSRESLRLITKQCGMAILPTGDYVAAENSSGRLTRWIDRRINE